LSGQLKSFINHNHNNQSEREKMKIRDLAVGRGQEVMFFEPDFLKEFDSYNVRDYDSPEVKEHIRSMADAIKENGILNFSPITVTKVGDDVFIVSGHCRKRAFSLAKSEGCDIKGIPAVVAPASMSEQERILDLISSNNGLPLKQLEKAKVVERLVKLGWAPEEVAKKLGQSVTAINNLLILLNAPEPIKELVKEGTVSATTAIETIQEKGTEAAVKVLEDAVENAKDRGKTRATAKDLHPRIKKVTLPAEKKGLAVYNFKSKKSDCFEADLDVCDFPCGVCSNRKELSICEVCKHFIEAEENGD
jgi:ParB family chromosome partitioning protein